MSIGRLPRVLQCRTQTSLFLRPLVNAGLTQPYASWLIQQRAYVVPSTPPNGTPAQGTGTSRHAAHSHASHNSHTHGRHTKAPTPRIPPITPPQARHEIHEGTAVLNVPYNPPGGGPGPNIPGGGGGTFTNSPLLDAMLTTVVGLGAVFIGGIAYVKWYKKNVLVKIEEAFQPGYDPALELAKLHTSRKGPPRDFSDDDPNSLEDGEPWTEDLRRKEQDHIDDIIHGNEVGHYYMLLGPKGTGKGTMIFDAMAKCNADGVSMCDAHPDLEVFRLRLGKALNYEFNEDTQTGLFQRRDPREGGPALDIERAMNKLEKVALQQARVRQKPLVLIINNVHFFQNDEEGRNMLLQLQQKAEAWAASGILTMVFSSDDFWPFNVMRKNASRMHVLSIYDLNMKDSLKAIHKLRRRSGKPAADSEEVEQTLNLVGGRLSYLTKVGEAAKARQMLDMAEHLLEVEKGWLMSQIGLIPDCDDDVMDEQKWSSCSWLLLQEFVKEREKQESERDALRQERAKAREEAEKKGEVLEVEEEDDSELPLPAIPWWRCRQIMTRADFMEELDRLNIIAIDIKLNVRPDSNLILHAAQQVTNEEGFQELLDGVRDRIDEIESLHRTRELTFKDLDKGDMVRLAVDKRGSELLMTLRDDDDDDGGDDDDD
ncbi:hypothetical protein CVT24_004084 [Panaeolus cyanescens]|uniref:AAA protein C-terminal winged helix domain-containing protein n=1 Tax=Panaeolus cyanescens TaxID=181874 RepID=A0A409Y5V4_9AGAR|nr:hypothetical protein CVT24_004084 [Panaeolus cyanescens]